MASFPELARAVSALLTIPYPTVDLAGRHLRAADMITVKGFGRGGAEMTARDAATLIIALLIDHERGGDFAAETARVMRLPLSQTTVYPEHFMWDLRVKKAKNAGEAIEFLIHDSLRERIRHPMEEMQRDITLTIAIDPTGMSVAPGLHGPNSPEILGTALLVFRRGAEPPKRNFERNHILHGRVLLEIAKLLELPVPDEEPD
ncbi:hypothetical protein ACVMAJ_006903 [Bradyrhizobium sp. USDA 4448]